MSEDDRGPAFLARRLPLEARPKTGACPGCRPAVFRWRTRAGDRGLELAEAVSGHLKIPKGEAAGLIDFGSVYIRGRIERNPSTELRGGEEISVCFPSYGTRKFYEIDPSRTIFRDRFVFAYDKEAGIPSQQVPHDAYNNVFAALQRLLAGEKTANRYAALHNRLDMGTSGVLLFALDRKVNEALARAFRERRVEKEYIAWVEGSPKEDSWVCDSDIAKAGGKYKAVRKGEGKEARTFFRVLRREGGRSLISAVPLTGRTHQIRIHLAQAGHPVAGDRAYGARPDKRLYLHAWRLALNHPSSGKPLSLEAPVPADWPAVPEGETSNNG